MYGLDNRPRASHSDAIAAAVEAFLHRRPSPQSVARYAIEMRERLDPHSQPVSLYLVNEGIDAYQQLLDKAAAWSAEVHEKAARAERELTVDNPEIQGDVNGGALYLRIVTQAGLAWRDYRLPAGTIARMAIDAWADRDVDQVAISAGAYAKHAHQQRHRARRDIRRAR